MHPRGVIWYLATFLWMSGISISCLDHDLNVVIRTSSSTAITGKSVTCTHNSTHVQFPSGPGNFLCWLLTTRILVLVWDGDSYNHLWVWDSISCS